MFLRFSYIALALGLALSWSAPAFANKSGVSPSVLVLPKGPGSLGGVGENVKANLNMGLMSYSIKVLIPKGRGTATPNLRVTYSSSAGAGLMGIGWRFQAGRSIERATVRGLPTYTNKDSFYAGGELVKIPNSPFYRARVEGGFVRYRWVQSSASDQRGYWLAQYPDGSKAYYGANSKGKLDYDAQVYGTQGTFRWELVTKVDRNGNRIEYSYFKDASNTYLDQIQWVFANDGEPLYKVLLTYEDRPDHISDGKPGFDLKTKKRLKQIQITSAGTRFRSYSFQYEDATGLSRLIHVKRIGRDAKSIYPVQFRMKYSDANFSAANSKLVTLPTSLGLDFRANNADFIDINGDGLPDVVDTSRPKHVFHINTVTVTKDLAVGSQDFSKKQENPTETSARLSNPSVQMLDVNGDGFTDIVDAVNMQIYLNKGKGKWEAQSTRLQNFPVTGKDPNMRFFDYNGDKKIDVISSNGSATTYWVSDGKGNWKVTPGATNIGLGFSKDKLRLIDLNGDGLQDVVHITKNSLRYRKYLGYGQWTDWIDVKVPGIDQYELSTKAQFADINGDGMADMVAFFGQKVMYFVNKNGAQFLAGQALDSVGSVDIPDSTKTTVRIADLNGNGSRDIVWINSSGKVTYLELFDKRPNLMTEISNGIGQRINVAYGSSVHYYLRDLRCDASADKACAGPWQNKMPMAFTVVTTITTWASRVDAPASQAAPTAAERPQIQSIYYHHGFYDGVEKKFRGFRHVETLYDGDDSVGARKDELKFDVGDKDSYFHGKLLERIVSDGSKHTYKKVAYTWRDCPVTLGVDGKQLEPAVRFICQTAQETTLIEGQVQSKWRITRVERSYDGFGNVVLLSRLGERDVSGDEKYTKTEFITPSDAKGESWLLRGVKRVLQCAAPPDGDRGCAETQYFYDGPAFEGLPMGQIGEGNLTRVRIRVAPGQDLWRTPMRRKYDERGNMIAYKDLSGQLREIQWDEQYGLFPVKETIRLSGYSLVASTAYDYALSKVVKSTDYNGHNIFYTYDNFGRLSTMGNPADPSDKPSIRYAYELQAPLSRIVTETRSRAGGAFDRKQILCFDGLGRKLSSRQKIRDGIYLVASHTAYNRLGMRAKVWDLYIGDEGCSFDAPTKTLAVSYFYDGLGRLVRRVNRDGSFIRKLYEPLVTRAYDEEDNRKGSPFYDTPTTSTFDGLGRLLSELSMPEKGKEIETKYRYSSVNVGQKDMIVEVVYADGSVKKQEYDLLANITKVLDPDRKEIRYIYDDRNQLIERIDARGKRMVFRYDALGRPKTKADKDDAATTVTYHYDQLDKAFPRATNLKGNLSKVSYPGGAYYFSYDARSLPIHEQHVLFGVKLDFKREYDNVGSLLAKTFPDGRRIEYRRDGAGRLLSIPGVLKSIEYNDNGSLKAWTSAAGVRHGFTYSPRRWVTGIEVAKVFGLRYTYDGVGNVLALDESHGDAKSQSSYQYDASYRLTQATLGAETLRYRQNDVDNLLARLSSLGDKSPVHLEKMEYHKDKSHQLMQAGSLKLQYDASGNVLQRGSLQRTWDYAGRCKEIRRGDQGLVRNWYGSQTSRLLKQERGLHTFYASEQYEIRDGVGVAFVRLGLNRVVALYHSGFAAKFYDDVGGGKADGVIDASDAWAYHATRQGFGKASLKPRPFDIDLTQDMLRSSTSRMLDGEGSQMYYHADHLGSIRAVTDASGRVVSRAHFYPYGQLKQHVGPLPPYLYMNSEYQASTGDHRFAVRTLDPRLGRWLSPDPAFAQSKTSHDELNSYGMVQNNPMRMREYQGTISLFGPSDDKLQQSKDVTIMGLALIGTVVGLRNWNKMRSSQNFRDMSPGKKSKFVTTGLMTASWALWGAASGASLLGANDDVVRGISLAMMVFWTAAELSATAGMVRKHRQETNAGLKGRKRLVRARKAVVGVTALSTVATGLGYVDGPVGETASQVGTYMSASIFVLSALATPAGARFLGKVKKRFTRSKSHSKTRSRRFGRKK